MRQKTTKASLALKTCIQLAIFLRSHCQQLDKLGCCTSLQDIAVVFQQYEIKVQVFHDSIEAMNERLDGVLQLVMRKQHSPMI
jgi:hypothetical protein